MKISILSGAPVLNALFHWWRADPVAVLVMGRIIAKDPFEDRSRIEPMMPAAKMKAAPKSRVVRTLPFTNLPMPPPANVLKETSHITAKPVGKRAEY